MRPGSFRLAVDGLVVTADRLWAQLDIGVKIILVR